MSSVVIHPSLNKIDAKLSVPGSKSITNRALIAACLSKNEVLLKNMLNSQDTQAMIDCLLNLGFEIEQNGEQAKVSNCLDDIDRIDITLDANQSGTTIRFLLALCCLVPGKQTITGEASLLNRPIQPLIDALKSLGAEIDINEDSIVVHSSTLRAGVVELDASLSSQFLTAIMLIAPAIGLDIVIKSELASESYVGITKNLLNEFGVQVNRTNNRVSIPKRTYTAKEYYIESDASAACYFWALSALSGGQVEVLGVNRDSVQGDIRMLDVLELFGARVEQTKTGIKVTGVSPLKSVNVDMSQCPDQIQTVSVLAAFADGISKIAGIETLQHKETDRLKATITELAKMGIEAYVRNGVLSIVGGSPKPAAIDTYDDHRTAMSFALAGAKLDGMIIKNPDVVKKTFPDFWNKLSECGVGVK